MENFLKKTPVEVYSIIFPAFILFILLYSLNFSLVNQIGLTVLMAQLAHIIILGGHKLTVAFLVLWLIIGLMVTYAILKRKNHEKILNAAISLLILNILASFGSFLLGMCTLILQHTANAKNVLAATLTLDSVEKAIFTNLPAFSLINLLSGTWLEKALLISYDLLFIVFSISFLLIAFKDGNLLKKIFISSFLVFIFSLPFFYILPATSPDGLYIAHIFGDSLEQTHSFDLKLSSFFEKFISKMHAIWISPDNSFFNTSSIPSLHAAWGLIAIIGIFRMNRKIGYLFAFWFIFNTIGAFYSLQHYTLDIIAGLLIGSATILVVNKLVAIEKRYYTGKNLYYLSDFLVELKGKIKFTFNSFYSKIYPSNRP